MSDEPIEVVAKRVSEIDEAWKTIGCPIHSPFMTMALLSLAVIPELRLTNKGLMDPFIFQPVRRRPRLTSVPFKKLLFPLSA